MKTLVTIGIFAVILYAAIRLNQDEENGRKSEV